MRGTSPTDGRRGVGVVIRVPGDAHLPADRKVGATKMSIAGRSWMAVVDTWVRLLVQPAGLPRVDRGDQQVVADDELAGGAEEDGGIGGALPGGEPGGRRRVGGRAAP
jgi:hypothetical protein